MYNIIALRDNMRKILNEVDRGHFVLFQRYDRVYKISRVAERRKSVADKKLIKAKATVPDPESTQELVEEEATGPKGLPCCRYKTPCQHWIFNSDTESWVNYLTGAIRDPVE